MARHTPLSPKSTKRRAATSGLRGLWAGRSNVILAVGLAAAISVGGTLAAFAGTINYTIVWGDTLSQIAQQHDTTVDDLADINGIANPDLIVAGDQLLIPVEGAGDGGHVYLVEDGDTLSEIALEFGVSVDELVEWNNLSDPDLIIVGDKLAVPADDGGSGTTASTPDSGVKETSNEGTDGATGDDNTGTSAGSVNDDTSENTEDESGPVVEPVNNTNTDSTDEPSGDSTGSTSDTPSTSGSSGSVQLHLVKVGDTLESIAAEYGVTVEQIIATNALGSASVTPGTILKIPPAQSEGVQLVGMPTAIEQWPLMSALSAASVITSYWGAPVSAGELLANLPASSNPHLGFRGDPHGMWGMTDDYGVYNEPLADVLTSYGFNAEAFYADGDAWALTSRLDSGVPIVVWVTYNLEPQERQYVEDDTGAYSLIPEKHALAVYGYDDSGVIAVDVSSGSTVHYDWDTFMSSWNLFDGMGLAISLD